MDAAGNGSLLLWWTEEGRICHGPSRGSRGGSNRRQRAASNYRHRQCRSCFHCRYKKPRGRPDQDRDFQEGQDVRVGEVLFEIDQEPFLDTIHENDANLARDIALAEQAKANIVRDEAQLKTARAQADRALALQKEGINSREQTETVVTSADTMKATLAADQAAVSSAEASVKADRARLENAKLQLSYTVIKAPINGRAGAIQVKAGNLIKENDTTLVTLLQTQPIYVSFSVHSSS